MMNVVLQHRRCLVNDKKKRWSPLRKRRIRLITAYGPSYSSESFELHKILRAVRKGQFSAPAKFSAAITTLKSKFGTARRKFVDAWVR